MTPICTYETHNLGDQLIFLHLLRALAKQHSDRLFWHFCNGCHIEQLVPVIADLPNIGLFSFEANQWGWAKGDAINVWKNCGATDTREVSKSTPVYRQGFWEKSNNRWNWSEFALEHHAHIAKLMGLKSPFGIREHLLFDYPALNPNNAPGGNFFYDFLFVNSEPCSGQFSPMKEHGKGYLDDFIKQIAKKHSVITTNPVQGVECTRDTKKDITSIGRMSLMCRNHIMVATGPMWATLNTTNNHHRGGRRRVALLDNRENLNMPGIIQLASVDAVKELARQEGWL